MSDANKKPSFARLIVIYEFLVKIPEAASHSDVLRGFVTSSWNA